MASRACQGHARMLLPGSTPPTLLLQGTSRVSAQSSRCRGAVLRRPPGPHEMRPLQRRADKPRREKKGSGVFIFTHTVGSEP